MAEEDPFDRLLAETAAGPAEADPFDKLLADTSRGKQFYDDSWIGETGEGIVSGVIGIGEGLAGLAAVPVDYFSGSTYGDKITEGAESLRDAMGLDPEGFLGKGAEVVTQFVVPGVGVASKVGKAAQLARTARGVTGPLSKAERLGLAAKQLAAAGAVDAAVSTDNTQTIADVFDMGPTQTEDLIGLAGQEKAVARMANRLKLFVESAAVGAAVGSALNAAGKTKAVQKAAAAASNKLNQTGKAIDDLLTRRMTATAGAPDELSRFEKGVADAIAFARYRGYLPEQISDKRLLMDGIVQNEISKANRILGDLEAEIDSVINKLPRGAGNLEKTRIMSTIGEYLSETDDAVRQQLFQLLPEGVRANAKRMAAHRRDLSEKVLKSNFLEENNFVTKSGQNIKDLIEDGLDGYLRRRYRIFENKKYTPSDEAVKNADAFFQANKWSTQNELTQLYRRDFNRGIPGREALSEDFLKKNGMKVVGAGDTAKIKITGAVTEEAARKAREAFLNKYALKNRTSLSGGRVARDRLETGMFVTRENIPKTLRALMGEIDDPKAAYLGTVADLAQFSAVDDYFGTISRLARENPAIGKLFIDGNTLSPLQRRALTEQGYVKLGGKDGVSSMVSPANRAADEVEKAIGRSGWGTLDGFYVPDAIYKNLTNQVLAEDSIGTAMLQATFGTFLKAKGASQYSKTVLSPITQIRNFTTAVSFALANGNIPIIGRGGSLKDASKAIFADLRNKGDDAIFNELTDARNRGILGTNAELREIQDTISKGLDVSARAPRDGLEALLGERFAGLVAPVTRRMEKAYQASDDFWKFYSYKAEQGKLRHALRDVDDQTAINYLTKNGTSMTPERAAALRNGTLDLDDLIKDRAAQIVRDTVPNYTKASSQLVRGLRKAPVGNFISFPAEILRTGFNIYKQALDDMASEIPAIRARGQQRLAGALGTMVVAPTALLNLGYSMSGVSKEEMAAYQRTFSPRWEKGSMLMPVGKENGKIQYINLSASNPYDYLVRFANRASLEVEKARAEGKDTDKAISDVMVGTLSEIFSPFMDEAILTEALLDITLRGGRTEAGAEVYNPEDDLGTKGSKMFAHVADALMPGFSPFNVSSGEFELGRFGRGVGSALLPDTINPVDKFGRERDPQTEIFRAFTGVTPLEFDAERGLQYAAYRMGQARTDAKRIFRKIVDDANVTPEGLRDAFRRANEAKLRLDKEYYQIFEDLETLGFNKGQVLGIMKREGISGARDIVAGKFIPFSLSDRDFKDLVSTGNLSQLPMEDIVAIQREFLGTSLVPDEEVGALKTPTGEDPFDRLLAETAPDQPAAAPSAAQVDPFDRLLAETAPDQPAVAPPAAPTGPRSPALLGSNPIDAAKNAEIQARQ